MTNENTGIQTQENMGLVVNQNSQVVKETDKYVVTRDEEGKFMRKAKYKEFSSVKAETRADKIWLMNVLEGSDEASNGLKSHVGNVIEVQDIITRPYDRLNEESGLEEYGVLTYLITPEKEVFVTSSKTVYFTVTRIMDLFGTPDSPEWENVQLQVGKEKGANGDIIKVKMIG